MRPKKVILCVNADEDELSVLALLLMTHGYRVLRATGRGEAVALLGRSEIDLVIVRDNLTGGETTLLTHESKRIAPLRPLLLLARVRPDHGLEDACLTAHTVTARELLERIKVLSARKRGPRPGYGGRRAAVAQLTAGR
jgi:DNA-binding response OmpR family regulator